MPARKPGGKYKGKIPRVKGEATLQAELEAKRRKAYEAQIARLQERRQAELMAARGLRSAAEEEEEAKRQRIMAMFGGGGRHGKVKKFFKYWKIGLIQIKKDKAIQERMTCWRRSCEYCGPNVEEGDGDAPSCTYWWKSTLNRDAYDDLGILNVSPLDPRPIGEQQRRCDCCYIDTGVKAAGCRSWHRLRDAHFEMPWDAQRRREEEQRRERQALQGSGLLATSASLTLLDGASSGSAFDGASTSSSLGRTTLRQQSLALPPPTPAPTARFTQSPAARARSASAGVLPRMLVTPPERGDDGARLKEVAHYKSGQRTLFDKYSGKMYVVGVV